MFLVTHLLGAVSFHITALHLYSALHDSVSFSHPISKLLPLRLLVVSDPQLFENDGSLVED
jgi:hypothetical protein